MSKLLTALIAALFAVTTTGAFAQMKDAPKEPASKATPATPPAKGDTKATPSPKAADAPATEKKGKTKSKKSKGEGKKTKGEGTKSEGKAKGKTTDEKAPK